MSREVDTQVQNLFPSVKKYFRNIEVIRLMSSLFCLFTMETDIKWQRFLSTVISLVYGCYRNN